MKVFFTSLGCDKNLVDSEVMLGLLDSNGIMITAEEEEADAAVVNTCCFIHDAKEESIQTILELAEFKRKASLKWLVVTGCLAQRYSEEICAELPEVDAIIGSTAYDEIVDVLNKLERGETEKKVYLKSEDYLPLPKVKRINSTGGYYAYLKIAEGCDKHCTYCVIPSIRGAYRSIPMEHLLAEAKELADGGARELIIVAQETTLYGVDLYGHKSLSELLQKLCRIEGIEWIRLLYCYPEEIDDELINTIRDEVKIRKYLDIPIQHASNDILKRMGRRTCKQELVELITKLRSRIPGIALRTSLITGFPGETEEEHKELVDFVRAMSFERLGVFTYSKEENTPAARMKGQITKKVKLARQKELMLAQQELVFAKNEGNIGRELEVIIDGRLEEESVFVGRTYMDAPGVDGCVFVSSKNNHLSGDIIHVRVTRAKQYDLIGEEIIYNEEGEQ